MFWGKEGSMVEINLKSCLPGKRTSKKWMLKGKCGNKGDKKGENRE